MDCQACGDEISAYLDGESAAEVRGAVEAHLRECAGCRSELESLRRLESLLTASRPSPVPAETHAEGVRRVLEVTPRSPVRFPYRALRFAAAVFLVVSGALLWHGWTLLQDRPGEPGVSKRPVAPAEKGSAPAPLTDARLVDLLRRYPSAKPDERRAIEVVVGESDIANVVAALDAPDLRVQIGASQILSRYRDQKVATMLLDYARRRGRLGRPDAWVLEDIGEESADADLVPFLFEAAAADRPDRAFSLRALREILRGGGFSAEQARALKARGLPVPAGEAAAARERVRALLLEGLVSSDPAARARIARVAADLLGLDPASSPEEIRKAVEGLGTY